MGENVETVDEYALEPADSKKASNVGLPGNIRLGVELEKMEELEQNEIQTRQS